MVAEKDRKHLQSMLGEVSSPASNVLFFVSVYFVGAPKTVTGLITKSSEYDIFISFLFYSNYFLL